MGAEIKPGDRMLHQIISRPDKGGEEKETKVKRTCHLAKIRPSAGESPKRTPKQQLRKGDIGPAGPGLTKGRIPRPPYL